MPNYMIDSWLIENTLLQNFTVKLGDNNTMTIDGGDYNSPFNTITTGDNPMIPHIISGTGVTFFDSTGRSYQVAPSSRQYSDIVELLQSGNDDIARLKRMADIREAVQHATDGVVTVDHRGLFLDGERLGTQWEALASSDPERLGVLRVKVGDLLRVEGDPEAPDGEYVAAEIDNGDVDCRIYVETDSFFGLLRNSSIKEIISP